MSNEPNPTMMVGNAPAGGQRPPPNRTPLIVGALGGCLVLVLVLACLGGAAWYFFLSPQASQRVATPVLPTPRATSPVEVPTVTVPTLEATTEASTAEPEATEVTAPAGFVAFVSNTNGNFDIYLLDPSQPDAAQNLTEANEGLDGSAGWSPDGQRIIFSSQRDGSESSQIYVMDMDGANAAALTSDEGGATQPNWSPDGQQIAYARNNAGNLEIAVMRADGSEAQAIAAGDPQNFYPRWSPDGQQIAFLSTRDGGPSGTAEIYLIGATSGSASRLFPDLMSVQRFNWSPDGTRLVFSARGAGSVFQIFVVNIDGTGLTQVTETSSNEISPAFSPDGQTIVFVSDRGGNNNLFQMAADGSDQTQLTDAPGDNNGPALRPVP